VDWTGRGDAVACNENRLLFGFRAEGREGVGGEGIATGQTSVDRLPLLRMVEG
jgi:hypothetical protein